MAAIDLPDHVAGNPFSMVLQASNLAVVRSRDALVWWEAYDRSPALRSGFNLFISIGASIDG
jgi:hypothetical protein